MRRSVVILGGGLAGTLLGWELAERGFNDFLIVEQGDRLGGERTWSFFASDFNDLHKYAPLIKGRWATHTVQFPGFNRALSTAYCSLSSERLHLEATQRLRPENVRLGLSATSVWRNEVALADGTSCWGDIVVDTRPPDDSFWHPCGFQKFIGWDVEFSQPHGLDRPVIMDATVEQKDGYRFMYLLPFTDRILLCEDTRYSDTASIDAADFRGEIRRYLQRRFLGSYRILREERGVLPIPLSGAPFDQSIRSDRTVFLGVRGGFFHPVTGYSFPRAAQLATSIADALVTGPIDVERIAEILLTYRRASQWQQRYYVTLNRLLFGAGPAHERIKIFERFYGFSEPLIRRFYAGQTTSADAARILIGRPPVPVLGALRTLLSSPRANEAQQ